MPSFNCRKQTESVNKDKKLIPNKEKRNFSATGDDRKRWKQREGRRKGFHIGGNAATDSV